jgi:VWFA-related protein
MDQPLAQRRPLAAPLPSGVVEVDEAGYAALTADVKALLGLDLSKYKSPQVWRRVLGFGSTRGFRDPVALLAACRTDLALKNAFRDMITINVSEFFRNANPEDDYFVIAVSNRPKLIASSTQSIGTIQSQLALAVPGGSTALLDAVYMGVAQMRSARYQRRALLIVSDGGDNSSRYGLKEIKKIVQESDVEICAIGLFDTALFKPYEEYMGKKWLSEITDATGGRTVTVDNLARLPQAAAMISRELRHQYVLGYKPSKIHVARKWRNIRVRVTPPPQSPALQAYYRKGYLVPEE